MQLLVVTAASGDFSYETLWVQQRKWKSRKVGGKKAHPTYRPRTMGFVRPVDSGRPSSNRCETINNRQNPREWFRSGGILGMGP